MAAAGAHGVWEIGIAPSLTSRFFMIYGDGLFRSADRSRLWVKTSFKGISGADANGDGKFANQKMAVDPINADVVYVGTPTNCVWRTIDAGTTWQRIREITPGTNPGNAGIVFDPHSGATNSRTNTIYVPSFRQGIGNRRTPAQRGLKLQAPLSAAPQRCGQRKSDSTTSIGAVNTRTPEHRQVDLPEFFGPWLA